MDVSLQVRNANKLRICLNFTYTWNFNPELGPCVLTLRCFWYACLSRDRGFSHTALLKRMMLAAVLGCLCLRLAFVLLGPLPVMPC